MTADPHLGGSSLGLPAVVGIGTVCLLLSGFFSGSETGAMSLGRARVHLLKRRLRGSRAARQLEAMLTGLEDIVMTCLIGTNLFNVVFSAVVTMAVTSRLGPEREWVAVILVSVLVILFSEILPKVLYREYPERLMLASALPLQAARVVLWPVRMILRLYSRLWRAILGGGGGAEGFDRRSLAALLLSYDVPGGHEERFTELVQRFLRLSQLHLTDFMRPLAQLTVITPDATVASCLELAARSGFSRFPVLSGGNEPRGYVLIRDLLFLRREEHSGPVPRDLWRPLLLVDGRMSPYELFEELRSQGEQMAMVTDPRGKVRGLLTLEDLIETVVGSISDEFDPGRKEAS